MPLVPVRKLVKWLRPPQAENVPLSRKSPAKRTSAPTTRTVPPGELVNNPVTVGIVAAAAATIPAGVGAGGGPTKNIPPLPTVPSVVPPVKARMPVFPTDTVANARPPRQPYEPLWAALPTVRKDA